MSVLRGKNISDFLTPYATRVIIRAAIKEVLAMQKRGWILYPYTTFHAKIVDGFAHQRFINNPAPEYLHLIF